MRLILPSLTLRCVMAGLLAIFTLIVSGCRQEKIPPYSEAEELKFRAAQAEEKKNPRADLAYIRTVGFKDKVTTFGAGIQNEVDLVHWGPEPLKLQKQPDSFIILNAPKGTALDGKAAQAGMTVPINKPGSGHLITSGDISMYILKDNKGPFGLIFDAKSAPLQELQPLKWYPPASTYRVEADWIPLPPGHTMVMHKTQGESVIEGDADGYLEFRVNGRSMRLYARIAGQQISIVFRDLTSKTETYPSGRFLDIPFPSSAFDPTRKFDPKKRTRLALDFNQATNPLCAYNPNASCPIPIPENRLPIAIPAGEKRYHA